MGRMVDPLEHHIDGDVFVGRPLTNRPLTDPFLLAAQERSFVRIAALKSPGDILPQFGVRYSKRLEGIRGDRHQSFEERDLLAFIELYKRCLQSVARGMLRLFDPLTDTQRQRVGFITKRYERTPGDINFLLGVLDVYQSRWEYLTERVKGRK